MNAISYADARKDLEATVKAVCDDHDPVIVTREGEPAFVMISLEDYNALEETARLARSPANAQRLSEAIRALENGQGVSHEVNLAA